MAQYIVDDMHRIVGIGRNRKAVLFNCQRINSKLEIYVGRLTVSAHVLEAKAILLFSRTDYCWCMSVCGFLGAYDFYDLVRQVSRFITASISA